jgi:diguanylate cyclase (GGDEF)-like protein
MKRRGVTTQDRRVQRDDRRSRGRSVAERALRQIRLVAVALLILGGAGYRPTDGSELEREIVMPLAFAAATVLVLLAVLTGRAARARQGRRSRFAAASTIADAIIVLGVIAFAGLPPRSFALVLLMLPFLEAALWFGLSGLAGLWTLSSVALGAIAVTFPDQAPDNALSVLVVAMPTLLLATIPVAMLAEHLVAQVGELGTAREAADDRAKLLGDLSAITADIFPLDVTAVVAQLVAGAAQLGATEVSVRDAAGTVHTAPDADDTATYDETLLDEGQETVLLTRDLDVPGGDVYEFTARVTGPGDEVARRVEALDLLVAQARVGLANAVLVQQLELLKQTYQDQATRDQLTGLLNRRGLVLTAEQMPGHLGVLFCDLDGFKSVNDTLGHAAGDELLEKVARRLEGNMRADSVLGRMGGDEFVVVVPGATDEDLSGLGRRIEIDLGRPFLLEAGMARIGVSIGAAHAAPGERDLDSLLNQADQLMYEVKRIRKAGRSRTGDTPAGVGGPA